MQKNHKILQLTINDTDDISILSSLTQDCLLSLCDMQYIKYDKILTMIVNRFCWEDIDDNSYIDGYNRTHTALYFNNIDGVEMRDMDIKNKDATHNLLAITYNDILNIISFDFSGGGVMRLKFFKSSKLNCMVKDMGEAWPSKSKPSHSNS